MFVAVRCINVELYLYVRLNGFMCSIFLVNNSFEVTLRGIGLLSLGSYDFRAGRTEAACLSRSLSL